MNILASSLNDFHGRWNLSNFTNLQQPTSILIKKNKKQTENK